ncbi:MAG: phenylalanine--tRNA ligase subunit alpha [Nitrososphaerales archaeon]
MSNKTSAIPLHPLERRLLVFLAEARNKGKWLQLETVSKESGLSLDQMRRAIEWLKEKKLVEQKEEHQTFYSLGNEGKISLRKGLPERNLVQLLEKSKGKLSFESLSKQMGSEFSIALGRAKKNGWVELKSGNVELRPGASEEEPEEAILNALNSNGKLAKSELTEVQIALIDGLMKRHKGLVEESVERTIQIRICSAGITASSSIDQGEIDEITPEVIRSGSWQKHRLRSIDVTSPAPTFYGGRKHPIRIFIDEVKEALVSLGFEEIEGPMIQSSFWNFDALFIPQQHSTREMQDTFYVSGLDADLTNFKAEIKMIKGSHERGEGTGSLGWQYNWSEAEASRVVLRTHTTALTIRYLSENKPSEARVFSVGKVFRNEKPNYKNNPEFHQIEGVAVGPKLNVRNMTYIISKFYSKIGFEKIKFWPTYFPYTEPSLQTVVYYEKKKRWIELGGMGVFRPEVTIPLGVKNPVLAWGLGLDRLVMMRNNVDDIRDLFGPNLGWLRKQGVLK